MEIIETALYKDTLATTYRFGPHIYIHLGTWPPVFEPGIYSVPFRCAVTDKDQDVTRLIKRFAGPRHILTPEVIACAFGQWIPIITVNWSWCRLTIKTCWRLIPCLDPPVVHVTNILGQSFTLGAR